MFGHWPVYPWGSLNLWISFQQCCLEILTSTCFLHLGCIPVKLSHNLLIEYSFTEKYLGTGGHVTVHNHSSTPQVGAWFLWCVFWFHLAFKNVKPYSLNIALIIFSAKPVGKSITKIKLALGSCFMHPYIGNALTIAWEMPTARLLTW